MKIKRKRLFTMDNGRFLLAERDFVGQVLCSIPQFLCNIKDVMFHKEGKDYRSGKFGPESLPL